MTGTRREWTIGLETWVMQDGNYGDFAAGETTEFALEFWGVRELGPTALRRMEAEHLDGHRYRIVAPVIYAEGGFWMIDIGVRAYAGSPPEWAEAGGWVAGEIDLSIDCFQYFEQLGPRAEAPAAIYTWRIAGVVEYSGPRLRNDDYIDPDDLMVVPLEVERTRAWEIPDNLVVRYELLCELQDEAPRNRLAGET